MADSAGRVRTDPVMQELADTFATAAGCTVVTFRKRFVGDTLADSIRAYAVKQVSNMFANVGKVFKPTNAKHAEKVTSWLDKRTAEAKARITARAATPDCDVDLSDI